MTREEAKQWLEAMKSSYALPIETYEAIDMAIEALSAELNCKKCAIKELWQATEKEDLVAVVRCKDCRHRDLFSCPLADNDFQKDDDYCSWGERREP